MSQTIRISGKKLTLPLTLSSDGKSQWTFTHRPGGWVIAESTQGERHRFMLSSSRKTWSASLGGSLYVGEWLEKAARQGAQAGGDETDLIAQFPGKVRKILVEKNAAVQEGEPLLLIEAMKMEFSIRAPYTGQIRQVLVVEGQQLQPGDRLIDMEKSSDATPIRTDL